MNQTDRLKKIRDLFNEVLSSDVDGKHDIGFYAPSDLDPDPFVKVLLGRSTEDDGVEVVAHLRYDSDTGRWNFHEGDLERVPSLYDGGVE